ncbi:jg2680 [Pararge aegeria aegeria]|uniref:Jg2680 protein n=1 Tax=Pararge aegeria aegeria TaxID=348720 RepID=A0A8S4QYG8_9NEOP|nr:jg2680 [Pararge aegeria aegeria]
MYPYKEDFRNSDHFRDPFKEFCSEPIEQKAHHVCFKRSRGDDARGTQPCSLRHRVDSGEHNGQQYAEGERKFRGVACNPRRMCGMRRQDTGQQRTRTKKCRPASINLNTAMQLALAFSEAQNLS